MAKNSRGSARRRNRRFVSGASSSGFIVQPDGTRESVSDLRRSPSKTVLTRRYDRLASIAVKRQQHAEEGKRLEGEVRRAVASARKAGATWELIAGYLGVTSEAVRKRFKTDKPRIYVRKSEPPTSAADVA